MTFFLRYLLIIGLLGSIFSNGPVSLAGKKGDTVDSFIDDSKEVGEGLVGMANGLLAIPVACVSAFIKPFIPGTNVRYRGTRMLISSMIMSGAIYGGHVALNYEPPKKPLPSVYSDSLSGGKGLSLVKPVDLSSIKTTSGGIEYTLSSANEMIGLVRQENSEDGVQTLSFVNPRDELVAFGLCHTYKGSTGSAEKSFAISDSEGKIIATLTERSVVRERFMLSPVTEIVRDLDVKETGDVERTFKFDLEKGMVGGVTATLTALDAGGKVKGVARFTRSFMDMGQPSWNLEVGGDSPLPGEALILIEAYLAKEN